LVIQQSKNPKPSPMKLHRNFFNLFLINHHIHLKLGAHQAKTTFIMWMILWNYFFANPTLFISQHTLKHSNFLLIWWNKLFYVLEQEKALKVTKLIELVIRIF
jgi:hypothetical protein